MSLFIYVGVPFFICLELRFVFISFRCYVGSSCVLSLFMFILLLLVRSFCFSSVVRSFVRSFLRDVIRSLFLYIYVVRSFFRYFVSCVS